MRERFCKRHDRLYTAATCRFCDEESRRSLTPVVPEPSAPADAHPEDFCQRCGRPNVTWFAPSKLWNRVARTDADDPMLCPVCFIHAAEALGINPTSWRVAPEELDSPTVPREDYEALTERHSEYREALIAAESRADALARDAVRMEWVFSSLMRHNLIAKTDAVSAAWNRLNPRGGLLTLDSIREAIDDILARSA